MLDSRTAMLALFVLFATGAPADESAADRYWTFLRSLEGAWQGAVSGNLGTGTGHRDYEFILNDQYLVWKHASIRLPQEKSPKGDYHRELGVFSFDEERQRLVIRSFIVEGFVNQYVCELAELRLVCRMEAVEGPGDGWDGMLTLEIHDPYRFTENFNLQPPNEAPPIKLIIEWTRSPVFK